jgi:hypothetical protein
MTALMDTRRGRSVLLGGGQMIWFNQRASAFTLYNRVTALATGTTEVLRARRPGFMYDPVNDVYLAWSGEQVDVNKDGVVELDLPPSEVYVIKPDTWEIRRVSPSPGNLVAPPIGARSVNTTGPSNGTFKRFHYLPEKNLFVYISNLRNVNVFFYRLDPAALQ